MNLLIVDDDSICRFITTRVAQTSGLFTSIHTVENGQEALTFLETAREGLVPCPDFILLDLNMPLVGGFDFILAFRGLSLPKTNVSIIVLTSSANPRDIERTRALGIQQYLFKPLSANDFHAAILSLRPTG